MKQMTRVLMIEPDSEAEKYFCNTITPHCKDKVVCRLGALFGWPYNEYVITEADYYRCRNFIKSMKGS